MMPDIVATIESFYRAAVEPDSWQNALGTMTDYVGGSGAYFIRHDFRTGANLLLQARLRADLIEPYFEHYALNPYSTAIASKQPSFHPMSANQLADPSELRKTAFHADILQPQKMNEQIIYSHANLWRDGNTGGIAITLDATRAEHASEISRRFAALTRHLSCAIDLYSELGVHRERKQHYASFIAAFPRPALLLDQFGTLMSANAAAEAILAQADGISVEPQPPLRLVASLSREKPRLRSFIHHALGAAGELHPAFQPIERIARRSVDACYVLIATPLPPGLFGLWTGQPTARLLLQIVSPQIGQLVSSSVLERAYDLTAAEARVAVLIASALSVPQTAARLGISATTVRTHLARCFDKLGVRSQVALANIVGSFNSAGLSSSQSRATLREKPSPGKGQILRGETGC